MYSIQYCGVITQNRTTCGEGMQLKMSTRHVKKTLKNQKIIDLQISKDSSHISEMSHKSHIFLTRAPTSFLRYFLLRFS